MDKENEAASSSQEMSPMERKKIRKSYRLLMNNVATQFDDVQPTEIDSGAFRHAMKRTDKLFKKVITPQEALLDAKVFKHLSRLARSQVDGISTNAQHFVPSEFADKLANYLLSQGESGRRKSNEPTRSQTFENLEEEVEEDGSQQSVVQEERRYALTDKHFELLGQQVSCHYARVPCLHYLLGSLEINAEVVMHKQRQRKVKDPATALLNACDATQTYVDDGTQAGSNNGAESGAALTEMLVESTYKQLVQTWKSSNREPVDYLAFVIDPKSFGHSVENMFHVSFLIKENKARIFVAHDGQPKIEPVKRQQQPPPKKVSQDQDSNHDEDEYDKKQVIASLTMQEWRQVVQVFDLKSPMITHDHLNIKEKTKRPKM